MDRHPSLSREPLHLEMSTILLGAVRTASLGHSIIFPVSMKSSISSLRLDVAPIDLLHRVWMMCKQTRYRAFFSDPHSNFIFFMPPGIFRMLKY
jgi:hypothetical protein